MKMILMQGLPGSGKSTWAKEFLKKNKNFVRVSRDDLRFMTYDDICLDKREVHITELEEAFVKIAINNRKDIIIDATGLQPKVITHWEQVAKANKYQFEIKSFLDVPVETCIERDSKRIGRARVGRATIEGMALKAGLIDFSTHDKWCCVDIDGTISLLGDRRKWVTGDNKNWNKFFEDVHLDEVNEEVREIINVARNNGIGIIFLSGRPTDKCGIKTEKWLSDNNISYEHLFMRKAKDSRSDVIIKDEIFQLLPKEKMEFVVDDRRCMISYWESTFKDTHTKVIDVGDGTEY